MEVKGEGRKMNFLHFGGFDPIFGNQEMRNKGRTANNFIGSRFTASVQRGLYLKDLTDQIFNIQLSIAKLNTQFS